MKRSMLKHRCRICDNPCFHIFCYKHKRNKTPYKRSLVTLIKINEAKKPLRTTQLHKDNKGKKGVFRIIALRDLSKKQYQDIVSSVIERGLIEVR